MIAFSNAAGIKISQSNSKSSLDLFLNSPSLGLLILDRIVLFMVVRLLVIGLVYSMWQDMQESFFTKINYMSILTFKILMCFHI